MNIIESAGQHMLSLLSMMTPTGMLATLGLAILGLACASIGWILSEIGHANRPGNLKDSLTPSLPDLRVNKETATKQSGRHGNTIDVSETMDSTVIINHEDTGFYTQANHHSQNIENTNDSASFLNATIANTTRSLRSLNLTGRKNPPQEYEKYRKLQMDLRSAQYKLETREAELREFRNRATTEVKKARTKIDELENVRKTHKASQAQIVKLTETNKQLKQSLENSELRLAKQQETQHSQKEQVTNFRNKVQNQLEDERTKLNEAFSRNKDLEQHITELNGQIEELQHARIQAEQEKEEHTQLQAQLAAERNASVEKLNQELKNLQIKHSEHLQSTSKLKLSSEDKENQVSALKVSLDDLKGKLGNSDKLLRANEDKNLALKAQLEKTESKHKEEIEQYNSKIQLLSKEIKQSETTQQELEEKRKTFREETSREIAALREKLSNSQNLETVNKNQSTRIKNLEEQLVNEKIQQQKYQEQTSKLAHIQSEKEKFSQQLSQSTQHIAELSTEIETLTSQKTILLETASKHDEMASRLQNEMASIEGENAKLRTSIVDLERYRGENKQLTEKTESLRKDLDESKKNTQSIESAKKQSDTLLQASNQELSKLQEQLDTKEKRIYQLQTKTVGMTGEIERLKSSLIDSEQRVADKEATASNFKTSNESINKSLEALKKEKISLETTLKETTENLELAENKIKNNEQELKEALETINDYDSKHTTFTEIQASKTAELNKSLQRYKQELEAQTVSYKQLESKLTANESVHIEFDKERQITAKQNASFRKQIEETQRIERNQKEQIAKLKVENDALKYKHTQSVKEIASVKQTLASMDANQQSLIIKETEEFTKQLELEREKTKLLSEQHEKNIEALSTLEATIAERDNALASAEQSLKSTRANQQSLIEKEKANSKNLSDQHEKDIKELEALKATIAERDKSIASAEKSLRTIRDNQQNQINKEKEELASKLAKEKNNSKYLSDQREKDIEALETLKATIAERDSALDQVRKFKTEINQKQKDNDILINDLTKEREAEISKKEAEKLKIQNELNTLNDKIVKLESRDSLEKKALSEAKQQTDNLQSKLDSASTANDQLNDKLKELHKVLVDRDKAIETLSREQKQFESIQALVNERQSDIEQLRSKIDKLSILETKLNEKEHSLTKANSELEAASTKLTQQNKKVESLSKALDEANNNLSQRITNDENRSSSDEEDTNVVEKNRLEAQVNSLITERSLGLERVRELSAELKSLKDKYSELQNLKTDASNAKHSQREVELLRSRIDQQDSDLRSKKLTIDQLRRTLSRMGVKNLGAPPDAGKLEPLEKADSPSASSQAAPDRTKVSKPNNRNTNNGTTAVLDKPRQKSELKTNKIVKKASTEQTEKKDQTKAAPVNGKALENDDLKKVNGIGPKIEKQLHELGITSYRQIAEFTPELIERVANELAFPGRIERDGWVAHAKKLYLTKHKSRS